MDLPAIEYCKLQKYVSCQLPESIRESAKLRAPRAKSVLTCQRVLSAYLPHV